MLTQGRLVPRQPWAIKRTTPTALRDENIRHGGFIHGNAGIISTALRGYNIRHGGFIHGNADIKFTALRDENIRHDGFIHGNADIIFTALRGYNIRHGGFIHGFYFLLIILSPKQRQRDVISYSHISDEANHEKRYYRGYTNVYTEGCQKPID